MKISIYELLGLVKDGKAPKKIKYRATLYEYDDYEEFYFNDGWSLYRQFCAYGNCLNDEVEIIEDTNEITAEQIMMATDTLNRLKPTIIEATRNWNKVAEAIKNNFNTLKDTSKEEKKIPEKIEIYEDSEGHYFIDKHCKKVYITCDEVNFMVEEFNQLIDYLKSKGDE